MGEQIVVTDRGRPTAMLVTYDVRLRDAALAMGLTVVAPA